MEQESTRCSALEVVEAVLLYYIQEGRGVTIEQIADLEARQTDEVLVVFANDLEELRRLGIEQEDDVMLPSDSVWEPTKGLLARIAGRHMKDWTSRRIRDLIGAL